MVLRSFALLQSLWPFARMGLADPSLPRQTVSREKREAQAMLLQSWRQQRRLSQAGTERWQGRVGKFDVTLHSFLRQREVLPLELEVNRLFATDLPQGRATFSVTSGWAPLFTHVAALEHIRLLPNGRVGAAFRLRWNAKPQSLDVLLALLEDHFQVACDTYRSGR